MEEERIIRTPFEAALETTLEEIGLFLRKRKYSDEIQLFYAIQDLANPEDSESCEDIKNEIDSLLGKILFRRESRVDIEGIGFRYNVSVEINGPYDFWKNKQSARRMSNTIISKRDFDYEGLEIFYSPPFSERLKKAKGKKLKQLETEFYNRKRAIFDVILALGVDRNHDLYVSYRANDIKTRGKYSPAFDFLAATVGGNLEADKTELEWIVKWLKHFKNIEGLKSF